MERLKKFFRNIDLRKFFGTIIGGAFFLCCVAYFTYAYYEWKSDETSIALTIQEADVKCTMGPNVDVSNIGPVLKLSDGVKSSFAIENSFTEDMAVSVVLDIISISDSLLTESFKWAIVQEQEDGSNFDYENPIIEGSFKNFRVGSNLITTSLQIPSKKTVNYEFVVYIDGNMKNDISMMQNSMAASLTLGNCGMDYVRYDELTQFAFYSADDNSLTFTYDYPVAVGDTYLGKSVTNLYTGYDTTNYNSASAIPWYSDGNYDDITTVTFLETTTPTSTAYWFNGFKNVKSMNLEKLDTSNVTTMVAMFSGCENLTVLDLSSFDTSNVTEMGRAFKYSYTVGMFEGCSSLVNINLNNWNTSNVTNIGRMFSGCQSLMNIDLSSFDTSNVTDMNNLFLNCNKLKELNLENFDTSNVVEMRSFFKGCSNLVNLVICNFNTVNVLYMQYMFSDCCSLVEIDVSSFVTSKVTNMEGMFQFCSSLIDLNLSNFDTGNVISMGTAYNYKYGGMFDSCTSLEKLDISNFNVSKVVSFANMFRNCKNLSTIKMSSFNAISGTNFSNMFESCSSLVTLDLSDWITGNVIYMNAMFKYCTSLMTLDLSGFDTSKVINMDSMFLNCASLTTLDLSNFDTSNVANMAYMFSGCTSLTTLDLSSFDTSNVTDIFEMFRYTYSLTTSIIIKGNKITRYIQIFQPAATGEGASITLYYVADNPSTTDINESTYDLVEAIIATKSANSNVVNGGCVGDYCTNV